MSTKFIKKAILAVALTLAVLFGTGLGDTMLGLSTTPSAYACSGSSAGGGC